MSSNEILEVSVNFLTFLSEIIVLGICIYYVVKRKSIDGILLLISSLMLLLIKPILYFGNKYFPVDASNLSAMTIFDTSLKLYGFVSTTLFTIGIVLLVLKQIKQIPIEVNKRI